jgi:1-acyl-sn-glycerol-3-phosphate acyltransferase
MQSKRMKINANVNSEVTNLPELHFYDWLLSALCFVWFAGTLLIFDVFQRISLIFGSDFHQRVVILLNRMVCFSSVFIGGKIRIKKNFNLDPAKPYIIISNHQSMIDIPILSVIFHTHLPRFVAKRELARWIPSVSINLRRGGSAIIDRSNTEQAVTQIVELGRRMQEKCFATIIFPEGTRARRGELGKFRYTGAANLILSVPNAEIIPVTIDGSWELLAYGGFPLPSGVRIDAIVAQPLKILDYENPKALIDAAYKIISNTLTELRKSNSNLVN